MSRVKVAAAALFGIVLLLVAIPAAQAGGGMGAGSGVSTCRLVAGGATNQTQTFAVLDPFVTTNDLPDGPSGDVVKINAPVLVCELAAAGTRLSGPVTGTPIPESQVTAITCYAVTGGNQAKSNVTTRDPFTEAVSLDPQPLVLGAIQFVCVPSATNPAP